MPDFKSIAKGGWHPSWENKGPSINRDNYKNPRAWMSKGQHPAEAARNHESTPLSSLKDPSSFAPPPKHSHYHGQQSASGSSSPASSSTALATTSRPPPPKPEMQSNRGLGAALTPQQIALHQQRQETEEEEDSRPRAPPTPYRADTTGLSTANLPKPPVRRGDGTGNASPVITAAPASRRPPPSLPPRLPPRQTEYPDEHTPAPPPSYGEATTATTPAPNRGAVDRLGQAGVSVPGFGIGGQGRISPPKPPPRTGSSSPAQPANSLGHGGQMNELQSRFARLGSSNQSQTQSTAAGQPQASAGSSWADKRAALETARNAHRDPSSVSFADARSAVGTANNFRQRHGDAIAGGVGRLNSMGVGFGGQSTTPQVAATSGAGYDGGGSVAGAVGKKPPPPPPPKKKVLGFEGQNQGSEPPPPPPPVPMGSKPRFG